MIGFGFALSWWGYLEIIYGWTLLKGYDIRWRDLANPLNPYQWPVPPQTPPLIPAGQILPTSTAAAKSLAQQVTSVPTQT